MSRDDFRRQLGSVFDDIAGSPSPALSDRVRSAVAEAPERKGSYWAAGIAATLIAAVLVGVLVVANPLNRPHVAVPPPRPTPSSSPSGSPTPSPSPSPSPTPAPTATPTDNLPAFVCGSPTSFTANQTPPPAAFISAVRTGTHTGYDRLTIEFNNGAPATVNVTLQNGTTFTQGASGQTVTLAGQSGVLVTIHGADAHSSYSGATDFKTGYPVMVEVRQVQDFEGVVQYGIGLSKSACYRAFMLSNPARLVIDIQNT